MYEQAGAAPAAINGPLFIVPSVFNALPYLYVHITFSSDIIILEEISLGISCALS